MLGLAVSRVQGDAVAYLTEKLRTAGWAEADIDAEALAACVLAAPPALADPAGLVMTGEQEVESRARRRCAVQVLRDEAPLLPGESLVEDHFTVLAADWEELPAGTVVVRRTTDRATLYHVFPDWQFRDGHGLVWSEPPAESLALPMPRTGGLAGSLAALTITDLLLPLAKALGGAIAGKAGTFVIEAVFPPSPPSYFDEVYRQLARVVGAELTQHDIDLITTRLDALLDWQRRVYNPKNPRAITDARERERLFTQVEEEIRRLDDAIAILRHPRWNQPGFTVFALAGGVYLALCQEACLMDYLHPDDPSKSSYFKTIQLTAADFANSLETTFAQILKLRRDGVRLVHGNQNLRIGGKNYMLRTYRFEDPGNGTLGPERRRRKQDKKTVVGDPHGEAMKDLEEYRAKLPGILEGELGSPSQVIAGWRVLIKQPLPV